ncbi:MFS transporter [Rhizomonospora bruguierae]|uniref:MFS transporter n=1 Tax=Rhizomonospora bruguierae TaxID=1581705 RepID=UPI001BCB25D4|nr:MFS transporter [Micromonospora sp. NBRC 107566]
MSTTSTTVDRSPRQARKVAMATLIGTTIEWYDFYLYGVAAALIFAPQFFPAVSSTTGTLAAFATFGVGFFARPLGALVFGHFGDRVGRKGVLVWSLILTGVGTFAVGILPGYASIGLAAPILLVLLRLVQGFGVGGEWGGAVLMAGEHAPEGQRGRYAGWPQFGSGGGLLLANGVFLGTRLMLDDAQFANWGWRVPFLLSAVLVVFGLVIRARLTESPEFERLKAERGVAKNPLRAVITTAPRTLLLVAGVFLLNNTAFFVTNTFGLAYVTKTIGVSSSTGLAAVMLGAVTLCFGIIYFSNLSDRVGGKRLIAGLYACWLPYSFIFFLLLKTGSTPLVYLAMAIGMLLTSAYGPMGAYLQEQFPTRVRYMGVSVAVQIGSVIGGGFGPLLAAKLSSSYGIWSVSAYVAFITAVSLACTLALGDRGGRATEEHDRPRRPAARAI